MFSVYIDFGNMGNFTFHAYSNWSKHAFWIPFCFLDIYKCTRSLKMHIFNNIFGIYCYGYAKQNSHLANSFFQYWSSSKDDDFYNFQVQCGTYLFLTLFWVFFLYVCLRIHWTTVFLWIAHNLKLYNAFKYKPKLSISSSKKIELQELLVITGGS
jgi:hypothetical protein